MQKQNRIPNDAANCGLILEDDRGRQFLCLSGLDIDIDTGTIALDGTFKKWSGASPSVGKYLCLPFSAACRAETQQRGVRSANDMLKVLSEITVSRPWHITLSALATIRYFYRIAGRAFDPSMTVPETIRLDTTNGTIFRYHIKGYDPELPKKKPVAEEPPAPIQTIKKQLPAIAYFDMDGTITAPMYRDLTNPSLVRPFFPVDEWAEYFDRPGNSRFSLCPILQPTVDLTIKLKSAGVRTEVLTAVNSKKEADAKEMFLDRHRLMEQAFGNFRKRDTDHSKHSGAENPIGHRAPEHPRRCRCQLRLGRLQQRGQHAKDHRRHERHYRDHRPGKSSSRPACLKVRRYSNGFQKDTHVRP